MKILVTGASGKCGTALYELSHDVILYDRKEPPVDHRPHQFIQDNLSNEERVRRLLKECDTLIHLAACTSPEDGWEDVLHNNIDLTRQVFLWAIEEGVDRIIFASSNHVMGLYEEGQKPEIYSKDSSFVLSADDVPKPDSYYGISKVVGEQVGRLYARTTAVRFYALRIGAVRTRRDDHPYAYAERGVREGKWERDSRAYQEQVKRLKAIWLSRRDLVQLVECCLQDQSIQFGVFHGVSNNDRAWFDLKKARKMLDYQPRDNAENWSQSDIL